MGVATFLIDTSALVRQPKPRVSERIDPLSRRGLLAVCPIVRMEFTMGARNGKDRRRFDEWFGNFETLTTPDQVWNRVIEVQGELVDRGLHRTVKLPDLIIAATAERHGVTVLHYDRDFDRIAEVTGQPVDWVVPPGTADLSPVPRDTKPIGCTPMGFLGAQTRVKPRSSATAACSLSREANA